MSTLLQVDTKSPAHMKQVKEGSGWGGQGAEQGVSEEEALQEESD